MTCEINELQNLLKALQEENSCLRQLLLHHNIPCSAVEERFNTHERIHKTQACIEKQTLTPEEKIRLYRSFFRGSANCSVKIAVSGIHLLIFSYSVFVVLDIEA